MQTMISYNKGTISAPKKERGYIQHFNLYNLSIFTSPDTVLPTGSQYYQH